MTKPYYQDNQQRQAVCVWCGSPLPKRRRKYCSDDCADKYFVHNIQPLWWNNATIIALERAGHKCEECQSQEKLEVHHIEALEPFEPRWNSPKNRQENLKVLCRLCHEDAHRKLPNRKVIPKEQMVMELGV